MTDPMLREAFTAIADRAEPVDDLTDRALRTATRRHKTRVVAGAAALALAVAVPVTVVAVGGDSNTEVLGPSDRSPSGPPQNAPSGLPENTPEERALARACMRNGPPVGSMGENRPDMGSASDFRLLTTMPVRGGRLAEVGSRHGYVLCVSDGRGNTEPPKFNAWPGKPHGGLFGFGAPLRVDGIRQVQAVSGWDELHAVVVGRAKPEVVKISVAWAGGRTDEAAVRNGFFLAQTPAKMMPDHGVTGPMANGAMSSPTIRVLSVTGYDAGGRVLHTWRPKVRTEEAGFTPEDCTDGLTRPRPTLCD
ncbi:hypothetical protein [Actinomadura sp. 9N407]|uniref:hypothetical protein n=1 Tax=Actinomadura sp. 9N407 TaxID=3375154 RepID=UPI0037A504D7